MSPEKLPIVDPHFWLDKPRVAQNCFVSTRTVDNWMKKGLIPYLKIGGVVRFDPEKVATALSRFEVKGRSL